MSNAKEIVEKHKAVKRTMTYIEIRQPNKDILYILSPHEHDSIHFEQNYNSIGGTYPGIEINCYIETLRGFIRQFPDFIENFGHDFKKEAAKAGFTKREPTKFELSLYTKEKLF